MSLGLPPLRTGGLTRYCTELMDAQDDFGYEIALLYPGRFLPGKTRIKAKKLDNLIAFEVVNPLPVPLTYGVAEPKAFMASCGNPDAYKSCIEIFSPDIIHIHSFQGIHKEFFDIVKSRGIPMLFTTHDYFAICPRCTLVNRCGESCCGPSASRCAMCCSGAGMTFAKSKIMQSGLYSRLKQSKMVRFFGSRVKQEMSVSDDSMLVHAPTDEQIGAYKDYLDYNRAIFDDIDVVASNTLMTERMYSRYLPDAFYRLIPITHAGLNSSKESKEFRRRGNLVKMAYFGGVKGYKGFATLCKALRILHSSGIKFEFDLYGDDYPAFEDIPEVHGYGRVAPDSMRDILKAHDVVVVPSIYHETCGFVVLEALCEHVPVVCSDTVGACELVPDEFVFKAGDAFDLATKLEHACLNSDSVVSIPEGYPITMAEQVTLLERVYIDLICEVNSET